MSDGLGDMVICLYRDGVIDCCVGLLCVVSSG